MTASAPITIRRGTTLPDIVWRMMSQGQPFPGAGSTFVLTIKSGGNTIRKSTADGAGLTYDNATGRLRWRRSLAESRQIALGRVGSYEIERIVGEDQELVIEGSVTGVGGLSDD